MQIGDWVIVQINKEDAHVNIACLDVHYSEAKAFAAAVVFEAWETDSIIATYTADVDGAAAYEPGRFYQRELSPLLAVAQVIKAPIEIFVIDAYCYLSGDGTPGLGAHFHAALAGRAIVVGAAKSRYAGTTHAYELRRGTSQRPLFITAIGMPQTAAAAAIAVMHGQFRIPTLIKAVDQLARRALDV